ncbi:hypothetical protein WJX72_003278 [[Myrmecia] bisecta]|uniref:Transcriptional regulator n=1 Tax=[Myrmecia] bisecta TaxID=41462 RepID=A0AAW1Q022_9CHLO
MATRCTLLPGAPVEQRCQPVPLRHAKVIPCSSQDGVSIVQRPNRRPAAIGPRSTLHHSRLRLSPLRAVAGKHQGPESSDDQQAEAQRRDSQNAAQASNASEDGSLTISQDWRSFRARLIAMEQAVTRDVTQGLFMPQLTSSQWAHLLARPERGCLLVARKPDMGTFAHSVILVLDHDVVKGSSGFVLNQPSMSRIAEVSIDGDLAPQLKNQTLFVGGPISTSTLHVLHSCDQVEGSFEILDGLYAGGLDHASRLVSAGQADASKFKLLAGYACWSAGQLMAEVEDGCWWVMAASGSFLTGNLQGTKKSLLWRDLIRMANIDVEDASNLQERS